MGVLNQSKEGFFYSDQEFVHIQDESDRRIAVEQYKVLADSLNNTNDARENSNNFWTTVNSLAISGVAYLKGQEGMEERQHYFFLWTLLLLGILLCITWIRYLLSIKKSVDIRNRLLTEVEKHLPVKIFTMSFRYTNRLQSKTSLTLIEMFVPYLFLLGYALLAGMLIFSPRTKLLF